MDKYTPKVGASFVRFDGYWGPKALPDRTEFTFFSDIPPQILALQAGQVDVLAEVTVADGRALLNDQRFRIVRAKSSGHEQVHMRCDTGPFADKRIRRALALSINRKALVTGLFQGLAVVGNDSPFAPIFQETDTSVPQREQDLRQAKQLMEAAGVGSGVKVTLTTERYIEIPQYAVLIKEFAKQVGIDISVNIETQGAYYGQAVFGQSDWLDSTIGITDYAHRGVPNVFLRAPLLSDGTWNAAHFKNQRYDSLVDQYCRISDLSGLRSRAKEIEELLLDETPILFSYFFEYLKPMKKELKGVPAIPDRLVLDQATMG